MEALSWRSQLLLSVWVVQLGSGLWLLRPMKIARRVRDVGQKGDDNSAAPFSSPPTPRRHRILSGLVSQVDR